MNDQEYNFESLSNISKASFKKMAIVTPRRFIQFYLTDEGKRKFNVINNFSKEHSALIYHRLEAAVVDAKPLYSVWAINASNHDLLGFNSFRTIQEVKRFLISFYS
ncbi:TPA: hypothetical protein ACF3XO_004484 [Vibrio parahaemolyticus]|uniref:hypothetical protein n=1 Tax=Vibrio sp. 99K-1 TaxID=2607603 RepID=UPI001493B5F3|nr:hypothetical protein [Vibrio sp. 99K-1]NOI88230.1 hypothetical protein [Vibrio sp. 99K-1]